jgi:hypothetical protein
MNKKPSDKKQLKSLRETYEQFRNEVADFAKKVIERNPQELTSLPTKQIIRTENGKEVEGPAAVMVIELMTMVKMAHMQGKQVVLRPNFNGTILEVYMEEPLPWPSDMMQVPKLQYSVEVK